MRVYFLAVLIIFLFAACGRQNTKPNEDVANGSIVENDNSNAEESPEADEIEPPLVVPAFNEYFARIEIDTFERTANGMSRIVFTNRTGEDLNNIVIRTYLNAFAEDFYPPPFFPALERRVFRGRPNFGEMTVRHVTIDGEIIQHEHVGTILTLFPAQTIAPDTTVQLMVQFEANIPWIAHRTGMNANAMWFGAFLPVLAHFGENGWHTEDYFAAGHPFIPMVANYHVEIITPIRYEVIGTGIRSEVLLQDTGTRITTFTAGRSRDFAFAVSSNFEQAFTETESGIGIYFYYYSSGLDVDGILRFIRKGMEYFEQRIGAFPFSHITIAEADFMTESAFFSQFILVDSEHLRGSTYNGLAHALANQWLALVVGVNRITYPWLIEGFTRYIQSGILFRTREDFLHRIQLDYESIAGRDDLYLSDGLQVYQSWNHYALAQGRKAMLMIHALCELMGENIFWEFVNAYYLEFSFRLASAADFIRIAEEFFDESLADFFDAWIFSGTVPNLP